MNVPSNLAIGEVARRAGIRASAIRYYELAGLIPGPARVGGRRRYDEAVLVSLDLIRLAQRAGFTIQEVRTLFHGFGHRTPAPARCPKLAERKREELSARIAEARRMQDLLVLLAD